MMKSYLKRISGRAMIVTLAISFALTLGAAMLMNLSPALMRMANAAVTNYSAGVGVYAMPIQLAGEYTATVTPVRFKLPYAGRLIGFSAAPRTLSGTAITVDFQAAGVSLLSAPVALLSAGVVVDGVITTSAVADEAELTAVLTVSGGVSPSVTDITILPTFLRR